MEWYYSSGEQQLGPVDDDTIKELASSGKINRTTMVWCEGMEDWKQAGETQLVKLFPIEPPPVKGGPPPLPNKSPSGNSSNNSTSNFGWGAYIIIAVVVVIIAVIAIDIGVPRMIVVLIVGLIAIFMQEKLFAD